MMGEPEVTPGSVHLMVWSWRQDLFRVHKGHPGGYLDVSAVLHLAIQGRTRGVGIEPVISCVPQTVFWVGSTSGGA